MLGDIKKRLSEIMTTEMNFELLEHKGTFPVQKQEFQ